MKKDFNEMKHNKTKEDECGVKLEDEKKRREYLKDIIFK